MSDALDPGAGPSTAPPSPGSTASTSIAVGSTPEEDLYVLAGHARRSPSASRSPAVPGSFTSSASRPAAETPSAFLFDANMSQYPPSMTSSVRQHVYEGGLRYHAFRDGRYAFPNDEVEQNRDDMKHTMTVMLCRGRHFYAPVEERLRAGGKCLDLGG